MIYSTQIIYTFTNKAVKSLNLKSDKDSNIRVGTVMEFLVSVIGVSYVRGQFGEANFHHKYAPL